MRRRGASSTGTSSITSTSRGGGSRSRAPRSPPVRPRGSRRSVSSPTSRSPSRWPRAAPTWCSPRRSPPMTRARPGRHGPGPRGGRVAAGAAATNLRGHRRLPRRRRRHRPRPQGTPRRDERTALPLRRLRLRRHARWSRRSAPRVAGRRAGRLSSAAGGHPPRPRGHHPRIGGRAAGPIGLPHPLRGRDLAGTAGAPPRHEHVRHHVIPTRRRAPRRRTLPR